LALQQVREAEKLAKDKYGRNACCIALVRNAGEKRITGFKWKTETDDLSQKDFLEKTIHLYQEDALSSKLAYDLMNIIREVGGNPETKDIIEKEITRIFFHKPGSQIVNEDFLRQMLGIFREWKHDYTEFANLFIIARFLSKAGEEVL